MPVAPRQCSRRAGPGDTVVLSPAAPARSHTERCVWLRESNRQWRSLLSPGRIVDHYSEENPEAERGRADVERNSNPGDDSPASGTRAPELMTRRHRPSFF